MFRPLHLRVDIEFDSDVVGKGVPTFTPES